MTIAHVLSQKTYNSVIDFVLFCFVFTVLSVDLMKDICSVDCYTLGHSSTRSYFVFGLSNFNL